jgi:anaerobic nitric oxide reductase transcription regulator
VLLLAVHFADTAARRLGPSAVRFSDRARAGLEASDWPGNVRELANVVGRAVLRASFGHRSRDTVIVEVEDLDVRPVLGPQSTGKAVASSAPAILSGTLDDQLAVYEREVILPAVAKNAGNWAGAARDLGWHRSNLHRRAQRIGLKPR